MSVGSSATPLLTPLSGRQAVIVDDDRAILALFLRAFRAAGCHVVAFSEFLDAKEHLSRTTPDILITDLRLGAYNGLQLLTLSHVRASGATVIVLTGYDDPVLEREAAAADALYLVKPITPEHLLEVVGTALERRPS